MAGGCVAVLGAGGPTGMAIVRALAATGVSPRAVTRSPGRAGVLADAGAAETTSADYASVAELTSALVGADRVVIVPPSFSPEDVYVANAVAAARAAGVGHVVLHSVLHPHTPTMRHHMRKAAAEHAVRSGDVPWTILQPAMYAQTVLLFARLSPAGRICAPFDVAAEFTVIDLLDVAEITAGVVQDDDHFYASYELVGSEPASCAEMLRLVARLSGVAAEPETVRPWELELPEWLESTMADFAAMCDEYTQHGLLGNRNVARMLVGRDPTSFDQVAARELVAAGAP